MFIITKNKRGLISRVPLRRITSEIRMKAKKKFSEVEQNSMVAGAYQGAVWSFSDKSSAVSVPFSYRMEEMEKICEETGISYFDFVADLKAFVMLLYGTIGLLKLREAVMYTIDEMINSSCGTVCIEPSWKINGSPLTRYVDFLAIASFHTNKSYLTLCRETLQMIRDNKRRGAASNPCRLSEFESYFIVDHYLDEFWTTAEEDQKAHYFPLYLFWRTTTILPLRVTEFLVTPYDCVREKDGRYFLTIRRSRLKGGSGKIPKIHGYRIKYDYITEECEITEELYKLFRKYQELTKDDVHPYGVLFPKPGFSTKKSSELFDTTDLTALVREFYTEVLISRHGFCLMTENDLLDRAIDDGSYDLREGEVMLIYPKHTRHLALINLIIRGCNPSVIRHFAGHASATMSANYYGNTVNLVRCAVKRLYEHTRINGEGKVINLSEIRRNPMQFFIDHSAQYIEVDEGRCYSTRMMNQDVSDCALCDGKCDVCRHFEPYKKAESSREEKNSELDAEFEYIIKMLKDENLESRIDEYNLKTSVLERHIRELAIEMLREFEKEGNPWEGNNSTQVSS